MKKIKITESQAKRLGLIKESDEDSGLKSFNANLGPTYVKIIIDGPNLVKNKEYILARCKKFDETSTLVFYDATGKIVGNFDSKKLKFLASELTKFDPNISITNKLTGKKITESKKIKITKEQYNRVFATKLYESMNSVDKTFKKTFSSADIKNLEESNFDIKKPNTSLPKSVQGTFGKDMIQEDLKNETLELIKYLYRKSDEFPSFWTEKGVSYDDICDALISKGLIIKKDGSYQVSKKAGSKEEVINAIESTLNELIGGTDSKKLETEAGGYPAGAADDSRAPYNQPEPNMVTSIQPKEKKIEVLAFNREIAILKAENQLLLFPYDHIERREFMPYAAVERRYIGRDEDGEPDFEYDEDFEIDDEAISNYVNDNISKLKVGSGISGWENGEDLVKIDEPLKQELISLFGLNKNIVTALTGMMAENEERTSDYWMSRIKKSFEPDKDRKVNDKETIAKNLKAIRDKELDRRKNSGENTGSMNEIASESSLAISPEMAKNFDEEDYSWWSDRYKEVNGFRPRLSNEELISWANSTFKLENNEYKLIKDLDETTGAASSGAFVGPMSAAPIKREIGVVTESIDPKYTHFAVLKSNNKIVDGWDYKGVDIDDIKYYSKLDLKDMFPEKKLSEFSIVGKNNLIRKGIDPFNSTNWNQSLNETTSGSEAMGAYDANALGGINRDGSFKPKKKTKAETTPQWSGGAFVEQPDCSKMNNNKAAQNGGCNSGASSLRLKNKKGSINAPSLGESFIHEALKT
jgi:hypothetical protein